MRKQSRMSREIPDNPSVTIHSQVEYTDTITTMTNASSTVIIDEDISTLDNVTTEMDNLALLLKRHDIKGRVTIGKNPIAKGGNGNIYKGYCFIE